MRLPIPAALVLVAAGTGRRLGATRHKALVHVAGAPLILHTLRPFLDVDGLGPIVVVGHPSDREALLLCLPRGVLLADGGERRQDSVQNGLCALPPSAPEIVLVHDAARPFVPLATLPALVSEAVRCGCAILASPVADTLKQEDAAEPGRVLRTVPRDGLWVAETPQACRRRELLERLVLARDRLVTDEASLFEDSPEGVALVPGSRTNLKITTIDDLRLAEAVLMRSNEGGREP